MDLCANQGMDTPRRHRIRPFLPHCVPLPGATWTSGWDFPRSSGCSCHRLPALGSGAACVATPAQTQELAVAVDFPDDPAIARRAALLGRPRVPFDPYPSVRTVAGDALYNCGIASVRRAIAYLDFECEAHRVAGESQL